MVEIKLELIFLIKEIKEEDKIVSKKKTKLLGAQVRIDSNTNK